MRILVATTGVLPPGPVAELCEHLMHDGGSVVVMTMVEVPRTFLEAMDEEERRSFLDDRDWESDTAEHKTLQYLEERGRRAVDPIVNAIKALGTEPEITFVEGTDPVEAIVGTATEVGADMIVMGATRRLFPEQAWTSVSAQVMERSPCPLVLVPGHRHDETADSGRASD